MTRIIRMLCHILALAFFFEVAVYAQSLYDGNQNLPPFGSFHAGQLDVVSLQNGNLHVKIPILLRSQRGRELSWAFSFDTPSYLKEYIQLTPQTYKYTVIGADYTGWSLHTPFDWRIDGPGSIVSCNNQPVTIYQNFVLTDPEGAKHPVPLVMGNAGVNSVCGETDAAPTLDGSGIWVSHVVGSGIAGTYTIRLKDGTQVGVQREDPNGNLASANADTMNRKLLTVTNGPTVTYTTPLGNKGSGPQYTLWNTLDSNGAAAVFRVDYTGIDVSTSFCGKTQFCTDIAAGARVVPAKLTLPNSQAYSFSWNNNSTGELQQITFPTGATISYTYNSNCAVAPANGQKLPNFDCRMQVATRTVTTDGVFSTWTYAGGLVTDPLWE